MTVIKIELDGGTVGQTIYQRFKVLLGEPALADQDNLSGNITAYWHNMNTENMRHVLRVVEDEDEYAFISVTLQAEDE